MAVACPQERVRGAIYGRGPLQGMSWGKVITRAAYFSSSIELEGRGNVLGVELSENEGSHFWLTVLNDLKLRSAEDSLIACDDGLKGFPEAIKRS